MEEVNRPEGDEAWKFYDSSLKIAWKTGTSFGNRDAWAIGTNSRYVVGVWVGNASGEGRPTLTGVTSAAPILFDVFNLLPRQKWFASPLNDLEEVEVCTLSGHLAQEDCPKTKQFVPLKGKTKAFVRITGSSIWTRGASFASTAVARAVDDIASKSWFVLPPVMEWYYKSQHIEYQPLPPFREDCASTQTCRWILFTPKRVARFI